jgi:hypothetical protein
MKMLKSTLAIVTAAAVLGVRFARPAPPWMPCRRKVSCNVA